MLYAIAKFIAITKEEGKEEEKKKVVFWSTKSLAKEVSFLSYSLFSDFQLLM